jgi:hypothetical protein
VTRKLVSLLFLAATVLGLVNVYGDDAETVASAERLVCGDAPCVRLLRAERTPIGSTFTFQTSVSPQRTRSVKCQRSLLLIGAQECGVLP